ncbi:ZIFL1 [Symbiodinium sp. CCMP2592]|nr:ZIFL1 [Symbiodinium sp. CCMP2592]
MSGQGDQLDKMSTLLAEVAAQLEQVKLQGTRREEQHQDLTERMSQLEARMDAPQSSAAVLIPTQLQPQSFTVPLAQGVDLNAPATVGQCMELVQMAMQQKVAPALGAVYSSLSTSQVRTNERVGNLEQQVRALRIRTAWAEKDMLFSQIEQAKRTIVCRNFPTWQTEADRRLTVEKALAKAGLWNIDGMWDLATTRLDTGTPGKLELSATSILTVPSLTVRKRILEVSDRVYPWYFHQEKPGTGEEPKEPEDAQDGSDGTAEKTPAESSQAAGSKEPAKTYEYKGGGPVKLSPGVTQFERRLASPLQGLMNAYRAAFSKFTKEPLVPRWKTLALVDSKEAWLGRIVYRRGGPSQTTSTGTLTDWECEIHIPEEHATKLLETWRSIWYDQLRQQVNQTTVEQEAFDSAARLTAHNYAEAQRLSRFLTKAIPEYNEGEDEGLDHWIARFRYEFPWPVKFVQVPADADERTHFTGLRSTEELMEEMAAQEQEAAFTVDPESGGVGAMIDVASQMKRTHSDAVSAVSGISSASIPSTAMPPPQPTKARPSYYPFSSQAELEKAVEEAKIAHINHGGVPTDYPQEAWESWCIKRRSTGSQ